MSRKNKNNMNNFNIEGDGNTTSVHAEKITQKQNKQNNIDKSKTIIKQDKYKEEVQVPWANIYNPNAILYKRTPYINDRPVLELYHNSLRVDDRNVTEPITMVGYVASRFEGRSDKVKYIMTNIINIYGKHLAAHSIINGIDLEEYIGKLLLFDGCIYTYPSENGSCLKYGIKVLKETIDLLDSNQCYYDESLWDLLHRENRHMLDNENLIKNYYLSSKDIHVKFINEIKESLNSISQIMFGVSGLIYPTIISMFLMRDDVDNEELIYSNNIHGHINIVSTLVVDYIIKLKPKNYEELYKILAYVILNYLGYNVDEPNKGRSELYKMTQYIGISEVQVNYYINNIKRNIKGGMNAISNMIPGNYKSKPGDIHWLGINQFTKRLYYDC